MGLTTLFGMGRGVPPSLRAPRQKVQNNTISLLASSQWEEVYPPCLKHQHEIHKQLKLAISCRQNSNQLNAIFSSEPYEDLNIKVRIFVVRTVAETKKHGLATASF